MENIYIYREREKERERERMLGNMSYLIPTPKIYIVMSGKKNNNNCGGHNLLGFANECSKGTC